MDAIGVTWVQGGNNDTQIISLLQFEQLCQSTMSSSSKDSLKATEMLSLFLSNWNNWPQIQQLIPNLNSQTSLFVVIECFTKIFMNGCKFENKPGEVIVDGDKISTGAALVAQGLMNFFVEFFITHHSSLSSLNQRSFYHSISHLVRESWFNMDAPAQQIIQPIIDNFFNRDNSVLTQVGLKLLDEILQSIITYSYYTSYLDYRKTMINFQRSALHTILQVSLVELKKAFIEGIVSSPVKSEAVQLLFRCLGYNFSLSFFEIEVDPEPRDLTIIAFPDKFEQLFADLDFIRQFIINTLNAFRSPNETDLALLMLKCLGKICSTRQSVFSSSEVKSSFREIIFEGVSTLLQQRFEQRMDQEYFSEIVELNFRLIGNFTVNVLFQHQQLFCAWIQNLVEFQKMLISIEKLQVRDDNLLIRNIDLWNKITSSISVSGAYESSNYFQERRASFDNFNTMYISIMSNEPQSLLSYRKRYDDSNKNDLTNRHINIEQKDIDQIKRIATEFFYQIFETTFKQPYIIPKDTSFKSHKSFKKQLKMFFDPFYDLFWWSQSSFLKALSAYFNEILQTYIGSVKNNQPVPELVSEKLVLGLNLVSNIILNPNQIDTSPYIFDDNNNNNNSNANNTEEIQALEGQLLSYIWKLIEYSVQFNHPVLDRSLKMVELSYLVFMEQYLTLTIDDLEVSGESNPLTITSGRRFYKKMIKEFGVDADYNKILHIAFVKSFSNTKTADADIIDYSLQLARYFFVRLKRNLSREKFKNLQCLSIVTQFIQQIDFTSLSAATFSKHRTKIYEIVSLIWIDDYYDNYLHASENVYAQVKLTLASGLSRDNLMKFLRDLIGLNNSIEVAKIFRFYFKHIFPDLTNIFAALEQFYPDNEVMKVVLDFSNSISFNKTQRLSHESNSPIGYQIFSVLSRFLASYSTYLLSKLHVQNTAILNLDQYSKLIYKTFKIQSDFFKGNYVNLSTFSMFGDLSIQSYLLSFINLAYAVNVGFQVYPKYQENLIENIQVLTEMAIELLFSEIEISAVSKITEICLMQTNIFLELQGKTNEQQFALQIPQVTRLLDIALNIVKYIVEEVQINCFSTPTVERNIQAFLQQSGEILQQLLNVFVDFLLTNIKNIRLVNSTSKLFFLLYLLDPKYVPLVGQHIIQKTCQNLEEIQTIQTQYLTICEGVERKLESSIEEKFIQNFKAILATIKKQFNG